MKIDSTIDLYVCTCTRSQISHILWTIFIFYKISEDLTLAHLLVILLLRIFH